jgi:hypothetical protein
MIQDDGSAIVVMGSVFRNHSQKKVHTFSTQGEDQNPSVYREEEPVVGIPRIRKNNRFERMYGKTPTSKHRA